MWPFTIVSFRRRLTPAHLLVTVWCVASCPAPRADPGDASYRLVFADEFNGATLHTNKWSAASPGWTMPNSASTASASQVSVGGGVLTLNATRSATGFTSGSVSTYTKYNFDGGYVEARIKLPTTVGSWPAFWGLYTGWPPEADIMEYPLTTNGGASGFPATDYNTNFHYTNSSGSAAAGAGRVNPGSANNLNTDYHTFAMDWVSDTSVKFYFDGAQVSSFTNSAVAQMASMYMILDYAVGGWPGTPDTTQWPVGFSDQTKVDWVRVWQKNPGGDASSTWNVNGGGAFATAANWTGPGSPQYGNQTAIFGRAGNTPAATITMPTFRVIGGITFNGAADGTTAYTIGSSSTLLQLAGQPLGGSTAPAVVQASSSSTVSQNINSKVELWNNTRFQNDMTGGQTLNFNSEISGNGALAIDGVGVTSLNAASAYTGGTTVGSAQGPAVLRATADAALGTGNVVIGSAGNATTARIEIAGGHALANNIDFRGRNNNSAGIENLSGNNTLAGTITANVGGGVYQIQSDAGTLTLSGSAVSATAPGVALQAGATGPRTFTLQGAGDGVVAGKIQNGSGAVALTKAGPGTWTLAGANTYTGPTTVTAGTLRLTGSLAGSPVSITGVSTFEAASATQALRSAAVTAGGTLRLTPSPGNPSQLTIGDGTHTFADAATSALSITGGTIDVSNNALVIRFAPGSDAPAATAIRGYIVSARNGPAADWQGPGITSADAIGDPKNRAVGYAPSSPLLGTAGGVFMGQPVDGASLLVRTTLPGDATLDGRVDFNDLVHLAQHYNAPADNATGWLDGDFDYSGAVDFNDLVRLAQNYNAALPAATAIPGAPAGFQSDLVAAAAVPEPGPALTALALEGCLAARRRRRR